MRVATLAAILLFGCSFVVAGCGGAAGDTVLSCDTDDNCTVEPVDTPTPVPDGPYCAYPNNNVAPQVVYPEPNAVGVPDGLTQIDLADVSTGGYTLSSGPYALVLSTVNNRYLVLQGIGTLTLFGALAQVPQSYIPVPAMPVTFANPIFEQATIQPPSLSSASIEPKTTYYIFIYQATNQPCPANGPLASFTTQ